MTSTRQKYSHSTSGYLQTRDVNNNSYTSPILIIFSGLHVCLSCIEQLMFINETPKQIHLFIYLLENMSGHLKDGGCEQHNIGHNLSRLCSSFGK